MMVMDLGLLLNLEKLTKLSFMIKRFRLLLKTYNTLQI
jgi:hypothetical protein